MGILSEVGLIESSSEDNSLESTVLVMSESPESKTNITLQFEHPVSLWHSHFDGSLIKVYKIESEDGEVLTYWNSSNLQSIRHEAFLKNLVNDLLDETFDGTNDDGWNEIMFELK